MSYVAPPRPETAAVAVETVPLAEIPDSWAQAWDDLAEQASEPAPFAERWFLEPSIRNLPAPIAARMLAVRQGPLLIGMIAVCTGNKYGRTPIRHVQNWQHYHAFLGTPLVRAGFERQFWAAILGELDTAKWAPSFFHVCGLVGQGALLSALKAERRADIVHRSERAFLKSNLSSQAYYELNIRKKKRKEIKRLQLRLAELGEVAFDRLSAHGPVENWIVETWIAEFLELEASGWKGRAGSALRNDPATKTFFEQSIAGAFAMGKLEILRLTLDGRPLALLVNFITPPGSYSFKIAFDENYARYSPGVLIQLENLKILDGTDVEWMDSCAIEDHSMINSIWAERREIVRITVPLKGVGRTLAFYACRALETISAGVRRLL
ncbi:GNAT family N-acetyltransferase [Sphingomonas paeninsulae]|uniref:GNAT family N-acetyltransferase n=1 Tax=Sphingomonas paeninsulae TaxID=2319844 RepID=A0A494TCL7_SPHPE|nr:GNAT family N-acetyltransferase [Sphingomonas paeninsulae]AYJ87207.1 GNAT family N-acetyltransferase [Sphingomonas paeninsulae]